MMKEKIIDFVNQQAADQLQFLIDLCNQNSYSYNKKGVDAVAGMIINHLGGILPNHRIIEQSEVGNFHLLSNKPTGKSIYLMGHLDTVFPPEHLFQTCKVKNEILHGPGTADMKGGIAVMVFALKALAHLKLLDQLNIIFLLNSDEEIGSKFSRELFLRKASSASICLVGECGGVEGELVVSRNGKLGASLECFGQDRHVSDGTHEKSSAILELAQKIIAIESLNAYVPGASINVGKMEGGLGPSTVAARASCLFDVRWMDEKHRQILLKKIEEIIAEPSQKFCRSEMNILNSRPAMPLTSGNERLFQLAQRVGESLGKEIKQEHRRGTSDANFFGSVGIPTLDGFGPVGGKDHTSDEYIRISSLKERTALLALFLIEFGKESMKTE